MGVVYRARKLGSERTVALKTVDVSAPRWLDNIRREIDALTRLQHPGVVRIVDHGVHHGLPWYAMDLLEGESLRGFVQPIWSPFRGT
jgi:serine/threonine protein kinase